MEWFGWISTIAFSCAYLPQLYWTYRWKKVEDVSVSMWVLQGIAHCTGLVYGVYLGKAPLIIGYTLGLLYVYLWLLMWWAYRDPNQAYIRKVVRDLINDMRRRKK